MSAPPPTTPPAPSPLRHLFLLCALGFLAGALYHAAALLWPSIAEPAPPWRHALFVGVNAALAAGILARPRWFLYVFVVFTIEQVWGHGLSLVRVAGEGRLDWASVVVLVFVPGMLVLLAVDARLSRSGWGDPGGGARAAATDRCARGVHRSPRPGR